MLQKYTLSFFIRTGSSKPGDQGTAAPQIFAKVDLLPIGNNSEKKKITKKYKLFQVTRKLLVANLPTSCNV